MKIEFHIDELMLHGFAARDRYRIGQAIERELARLLTVQGVPSTLTQSADIAKMNAGSFNVSSASKSATIGAQVAQAVYGGLKR